MPLKPLPVWPFEPNWTSSVSETLEWKTDILQSPSGSEQRRSLRILPRRTIDYTVTAEGEERSLLDNLLTTFSAQDWYLPIWYDVRITTAQATATFIPCPTNGFTVGMAVFVAGASLYDYQVTEITARNASGITISPALAAPPALGARIFPMAVGRLVEEPSQTVITNGLTTAEPQFLISDYPDVIAPPPSDAGLSDVYRYFYVLTQESNWTDGGSRGQQRLLDMFDTGVGKPEQFDTAMRPFPTQQHHWVLDGQADHKRFYSLMSLLRGRAVPVWVPTWMDDMRLTAAVSSASTSIQIARCGYFAAGGPRPEREDIMIETLDGQRFYRRITGAVAGATTEVIQLDSALGVSITPMQVIRICFISLMRLDHDSIEVNHITDTDGASEVSLTFRAAPDTRTPAPAFNEV